MICRRFERWVLIPLALLALGANTGQGCGPAEKSSTPAAVFDPASPSSYYNSYSGTCSYQVNGDLVLSTGCMVFINAVSLSLQGSSSVHVCPDVSCDILWSSWSGASFTGHAARGILWTPGPIPALVDISGAGRKTNTVPDFSGLELSGAVNFVFTERANFCGKDVGPGETARIDFTAQTRP